MVWQPNILNNCYELSGGYAPEPPIRGSVPGPRWGTSVPQTPCVLHLQILAAPLVGGLITAYVPIIITLLSTRRQSIERISLGHATTNNTQLENESESSGLIGNSVASGIDVHF